MKQPAIISPLIFHAVEAPFSVLSLTENTHEDPRRTPKHKAMAREIRFPLFEGFCGGGGEGEEALFAKSVSSPSGILQTLPSATNSPLSFLLGDTGAFLGHLRNIVIKPRNILVDISPASCYNQGEATSQTNRKEPVYIYDGF